MKSEPSVFGIDDLAKRSQQTEHWDGVRNYQVRNMLRDQFKIGDQALFYHSSCEVPGIVGLMKVVKAGYPDDSALNPKSKYYDVASTPDNPRWFMVDVKFVKKFPRVITLNELKNIPGLTNMPLLRKGNRLSIMPVTAKEWEIIMELI
jgi:predicted RNA-binding protein with PUA-like domain